MKIQSNGIAIEVEDSAQGQGEEARARPTVLLVMGLGMQLVAWPPAFVQGLVDAGYRVVRFDNRDIGLSQHFDHLGRPNVAWAFVQHKLGLPMRPPYSVQDMAQDTLGVMDVLGIARAHVVGISMGGMIAQRVALAAPQRVQSLTSIMSSSGARGLPEARADVVRALLGRPADRSPEAILAFYLRLYRAIASPGYPTAEEELHRIINLSTARSYHPEGSLRQTIAIVADRSRAEALHGLRVPTLVVHGREDRLVPIACGEDTARRIPGAQFVAVGGMGHDLAPGVVARIEAALMPFLEAHAG